MSGPLLAISKNAIPSTVPFRPWGYTCLSDNDGGPRKQYNSKSGNLWLFLEPNLWGWHLSHQSLSMNCNRFNSHIILVIMGILNLILCNISFCILLCLFWGGFLDQRLLIWALLTLTVMKGCRWHSVNKNTACDHGKWWMDQYLCNTF